MAKGNFYKGDTVKFAEGCNPYLQRPITREEVQAWYDSPASQGMNCAGETKLAPRGVTRSYKIDPDALYVVVKARARNRIGWRSLPGWAVIRAADGVEWHARRESLVKVASV